MDEHFQEYCLIFVFFCNFFYRPSEPDCPDNSEYTICGTACPRTCDDVANPRGIYDGCTRQCVLGCQCMEGYVLSGHRCVPEEQCGCRDENGYYHQVNCISQNAV